MALLLQRGSLARRLLGSLMAIVGALWLAAGAGAAEGDCGSLTNTPRGPIKPLDYRTERALLSTVETYHFTPQVEGLVRGMTGLIGGDIDYVLHLYPNHHRALAAMSRLGQKEKTDRPKGANFAVECYFDRALRFRNDDLIVRMLYAQFLIDKGRKEEANRQLDLTAELAGDNPLTHHNAGLLYFETGAYEKALREAQIAIRQGWPKTDLKDKLRSIGKWSEPEPDAASAPTK